MARMCIAYTSDNHGVEFISDQKEWDRKWDKDVMFYDVLNKSQSMSIKQLRKALNFSNNYTIFIPLILFLNEGVC